MKLEVRQIVAALLVPLLACAQNVHVRHRDGAAPDVTHQAPSTTIVPVTQAEFTSAFRVLGKQAPTWASPLEDARRLFKVPERSGVYLYEVRTERILPTTEDNPMLGVASEQEFVRDYFQWCRANLGPGDCLRVFERN